MYCIVSIFTFLISYTYAEIVLSYPGFSTYNAQIHHQLPAIPKTLNR